MSRDTPERLYDFGSRVERLESALRMIQGPEDRGPWIDVYRAAGGGYEGLQAVAEEALKHNCDFCQDTHQVVYHGAGAFAELRACSACGDGRFLAETTIPNVSVLDAG